MKQKLTVLACVGLALLLSTGFAFAQNTVSVESKNVNRCATVQVKVNLNNLSDAVESIGLPLLVSNGTLTGVAAGPALAGHTVAINQSGNQVLVNAVGNCLPMAGPHHLLTLTIAISDDCSEQVTVDLDPSPLVASAEFLLSGCSCCEVPAVFVPGTLTPVNQLPVCGVNTDVLNFHFSGAIVNKQLNASDPDPCDGITFSKVSGPGTVSGDGKYNWDPECADLGTHTIVFRATDDCGGYKDCDFDVQVIHNAPVCQAVPDQTVHWADHLTAPLPATDDGCPDPLTWTLISEDLVGPVSVTGGVLNYDGRCADIPGPHTVVYEVSDGDKTCQSEVDVYVTNTAPTVLCPDPIDPAHLCNHQMVGGGDGIFNLGDLVAGQAVGDDDDGDPVTYSIISVTVDAAPYDPVNDPAINGLGYFTWQSTGSDPVGTYEFCIEVDDGCYQGTCCFSVDVELNMYMAIYDETGTVDTIPALPGQQVCVYLNIFPDIPLGGIDVLLCYDMTGLSFLGNALAMNDLDKWEYFTYRTSVDGNCGSSACPTGYIRIVAIADLDNGPSIHPPSSAFGLEGAVVELCFQVTSDWNFLGQCLPINFCTLTCGDNALASKDGYTTYIPIDGPDCPDPKPGYSYERELELCGGAICVREPKDARGDINLNGVTNEISDAVLFSRYFIEGDDVWDPLYEAVQVQATDINNDGVPLTVADLVYLIRVITGDEQPFPSDEGNPKVSPYAGQADALVKVGNDNVSIITNSAVDLGGALFVFRYSGMGVGEAVGSEAASNMVVKSRTDRGELRVLVAPQISTNSDLGTITAGSHEVVTIPTSGEGTIDLVEVQFADAHGAMLTSNIAKIAPPKSYALLQNYPNPFNAGTVIRFDLKESSDWMLQVYNITGQVVRTFSGHDEASQVSVTWDGTDREGNQTASGVYFYRINAGDYTASKKMTLVK